MRETKDEIITIERRSGASKSMTQANSANFKVKKVDNSLSY